jgi:hypothetical protein
MRSPFISFICIIVCCCCVQDVAGQVRVRRGIRLPKFRHKDRSVQKTKEAKPLPAFPFIKPIAGATEKINPTDEHFYVKWTNIRNLRYDDFRYNRNLYNKLVSDKDTDLINKIYPDYTAFYRSLRQRIESDPASMDELQAEHIERILNAKMDSVQKGYISPESFDIDLSFSINIDSPAASVITLNPVIYALNDTSWYFNITALFNKYESWMMVKSADILEHEQIHFDIFELFARKMRKHLLETLNKHGDDGMTYDMATDITPYYEQLYAQLNQMQLNFDKQTGELTAANQPLQATNAAWIKTLKTQLAALSGYSLAEGTMVLRR